MIRRIPKKQHPQHRPSKRNRRYICLGRRARICFRVYAFEHRIHGTDDLGDGIYVSDWSVFLPQFDIAMETYRCRLTGLLTLLRYPSLNNPAPHAITGHNLSHLPFSVLATLPRRRGGSAPASTSAGFSCDAEDLDMMTSAPHCSAINVSRRTVPSLNSLSEKPKIDCCTITVSLFWRWREDKISTTRAAGPPLVFIYLSSECLRR